MLTHISEGFDFLGQNVRKYCGKMLITPAARGLRNHLQKVRLIVKRNVASKQGDLIRQLNRYWYTGLDKLSSSYCCQRDVWLYRLSRPEVALALVVSTAR